MTRRSLCLLAATGATALASGCGAGSPPVRTAEPSPPPATGGTQLYDGQAFAIAYPAGWWVYAAEQPRRFGTDTTIVDPDDHARSVRIEVRAPGAQPVATTGRRFHHVRFQGRDALRSAFRIRRGGRTVRGEELVFRDRSGRRVAIVTQAPSGQYRAWSQRLTGARNSFRAY